MATQLLTSPGGTVAGYLMQFDGRGVFSPDGRIECTADQVAAHNAELARLEIETLKRNGRGVLYLTTMKNTMTCEPDIRADAHRWCVWWLQTRVGKIWIDAVAEYRRRMSSPNIGDNQIARVRRCKR